MRNKVLAVITALLLAAGGTAWAQSGGSGSGGGAGGTGGAGSGTGAGTTGGSGTRGGPTTSGAPGSSIPTNPGVSPAPAPGQPIPGTTGEGTPSDRIPNNPGPAVRPGEAPPPSTDLPSRSRQPSPGSENSTSSGRGASGCPLPGAPAIGNTVGSGTTTGGTPRIAEDPNVPRVPPPPPANSRC